MTPAMQSTEPYVRWLIRRDFPAVLAIEREAFASPWTEDTLVAALRKRTCHARVADVQDIIAGHAIFEFRGTEVTLLRLAVRADFRRLGIATALVNHVVAKIGWMKRRTRARVWVPETNLPAQLLFARSGFRCTRIECYEEPEYVFELSVQRP